MVRNIEVTVGSVSAVIDPPVTSTTRDVYPTLESHPGAVWTRSGNTLTSAGSRDLPVYDSTDGFVLMATKPTWANSGCRFAKTHAEAAAAPELTTFVGNATNKYELVSEYDGQVIERMFLPDSRIRILHKNVVVRDCYVGIGWYATRKVIQSNLGVVADVLTADTSGLRMEFVTVDPLNAGENNTADDSRVCGFFFNAGTAWRCAVKNVSDAFAPDIHPLSGNGGPLASHIWGCYAETRYFYPEPATTDGTHNDGTQWSGGAGFSSIGNTYVNPTGGVVHPVYGKTVIGQCIIIDPYHAMNNTQGNRDAAQISDCYLWGNWLSGAYTQISSWSPQQEGGPGSPNLWVKNNRHGGQCKWPMLYTPTQDAIKTASTGSVVDANIPGQSYGLIWNNASGGVAQGAPLSPSVQSIVTDLPGISVGSDTVYAGNDRIVYGGTICYLAGKGKTPPTTWVRTGAWSQVSGTTVTITNAAATDGTNYGYFTVPKSTAQQVLVMRYTPTGMTASETITVTIPPWQTGGI